MESFYIIKEADEKEKDNRQKFGDIDQHTFNDFKNTIDDEVKTKLNSISSDDLKKAFDEISDGMASLLAAADYGNKAHKKIADKIINSYSDFVDSVSKFEKAKPNILTSLGRFIKDVPSKMKKDSEITKNQSADRKNYFPDVDRKHYSQQQSKPIRSDIRKQTRKENVNSFAQALMINEVRRVMEKKIEFVNINEAPEKKKGRDKSPEELLRSKVYEYMRDFADPEVKEEIRVNKLKAALSAIKSYKGDFSVKDVDGQSTPSSNTIDNFVFKPEEEKDMPSENRSVIGGLRNKIKSSKDEKERRENIQKHDKEANRFGALTYEEFRKAKLKAFLKQSGVDTKDLERSIDMKSVDDEDDDEQETSSKEKVPVQTADTKKQTDADKENKDEKVPTPPPPAKLDDPKQDVSKNTVSSPEKQQEKDKEQQAVTASQQTKAVDKKEPEQQKQEPIQQQSISPSPPGSKEEKIDNAAKTKIDGYDRNSAMERAAIAADLKKDIQKASHLKKKYPNLVSGLENMCVSFSSLLMMTYPQMNKQDHNRKRKDALVDFKNKMNKMLSYLTQIKEAIDYGVLPSLNEMFGE